MPLNHWHRSATVVRMSHVYRAKILGQSVVIFIFDTILCTVDVIDLME